MLRGSTFLCRTVLTCQDLGGMTLAPGFYIFTTSAFLDGVLTLDAQGDLNAVFVFQTGSTLIVSTNSSVVVINGGKHSNVFWQVGSSASIGTNTSFVGNILTYANNDMVRNAI